MEGFQVLLNEKQTKDLQKFVYDLTSEAIKRAVHDVGADKDFLNQKEMSNWLGVSINTLKNYVREGLPIIVIGGRNFYSKNEVSKFMLQRQKLDA